MWIINLENMNKSESRECNYCLKIFDIEPSDFDYYQKIKVPAPTWCPRCRLMRRLAWLKTFTLYKRKCRLCNKEIL